MIGGWNTSPCRSRRQVERKPVLMWTWMTTWSTMDCCECAVVHDRRPNEGTRRPGGMRTRKKNEPSPQKWKTDRHTNKQKERVLGHFTEQSTQLPFSFLLSLISFHFRKKIEFSMTSHLLSNGLAAVGVPSFCPTLHTATDWPWRIIKTISTKQPSSFSLGEKA